MRSFVRMAGVLGWFVLSLAQSVAADLATVRVGILQYGTVSWELEVMQGEGLLEREGVRIEIVPLALKDAANVAIQGGAVDVIVNDWIWVSRQRSEGRDYTFSPYSRAVGTIMVRPDAQVASPADLRGKRLGVAGGPLDKSWLLFRAYARKHLGEDGATLVQADFAAPPLLNELIRRGELQAVLNFWHFSARLAAEGMVGVLSVDEMLAGLGVQEEVPLVGWVFSERWADANREAVSGFLRASQAAKQLMQSSDQVWVGLRPLMRVEDDASFHALRDGFRAGIPQASLEQAEGAARAVFAILATEGGPALVGRSNTLADGTFWRGSR